MQALHTWIYICWGWREEKINVLVCLLQLRAQFNGDQINIYGEGETTFKERLEMKNPQLELPTNHFPFHPPKERGTSAESELPSTGRDKAGMAGS